MNQIIGAFEKFSPLKTELPFAYISRVGYQYQRAMLILDPSLNDTDLNIVLEVIAYMQKLGEDAVLELTNDLLENEWHAHSETLKIYRAHHQLQEPISSQGIKIEWSAVFAIVALTNIMNLIDLGSHDPTDLNEASTIDCIKYDLPLEAMEAVAYAEAFKSKEITRAKRSKAVSKKRLGDSHDTKLEIVTIFNQLPSNIPVRQAALLITEQLSNNTKKRFTTENKLVQIEVWLGQYKKGTLPGSDNLPPYKPIV
jgi:hypothetical protein